MINEVIAGRLEHELCVVTNLENRILKKQNAFLDSAYAKKSTQVSELQDANTDQAQALSSSGTAIKTQAKEIRKQKRLKWVFLSIGVIAVLLTHAK